LGLDVAFPAVFLALLYPMLRRRRTLIVVGIAAVATAAATPVVPIGVPLVVALTAAVVYLVLRDRWKARP
jgi:predicted branched-subunit amino acid permease